MVTLQDIIAAHDRIIDVVTKTPVMTSRTVDQMAQCKVFFKCENFQRAGAFKFRGAFNAVSQLDDDERRRGVITHSSGNHAQALALASSILGVKAVVVMPRNSPRVKIEATRGYGAEVVLCEPTLESRTATAQKLVAKHGYVIIHPYNNERVIAGAGTAALELIEEIGPLDCVLAPVGGGGLLSGTSIATKGLCPAAKVIGAEPKNADDALRSFRTKTLQPSVNPKTIADGLRTSLGDITFPIILENVDDIVTVSESEILAAMKLLWERMKLVVEPSAAVPLAALLNIESSVRQAKVGIILSGGNLELDSLFTQYEQIIAKE
jgi:threonine dehydratase